MKNKIFSVWLKELCSLVFVQSLQALLLTIMLSVVVRLYIGIDMKDEASTEALGVYAIFVLYIIPKVELLVKKIFGLGSGVMNDGMMASGKNSFMKTALALRGASTLMNNIGKVGSGVVGLFPSKRKIRTAENNLKAAEKNEETAKQLSQSRVQNPSNRMVTSGNSQISNSMQNSGAYNLADLTTAIKNANAEDPQKALDKAKRELNQKRLDSLKKLTSGTLETVGAIGGASLGAVVGLGLGDDDILSDMAIGAGVGDKLGKYTTDITYGAIQSVRDNYNDTKDSKAAYQKSKAKLQKAQEEYNKVISQANSQNNIVTSTSSTGKAKNVSSKLTEPQRAIYEKATAAKQAGNMDEYHKNMNIVAGMRKQEKIQNSTEAATSKINAETKKVKNAINETKKSMGRTTSRSSYNNAKKMVNDKINNVDDV